MSRIKAANFFMMTPPEEILTILKHHPEGIGIDGILGGLKKAPHRRTVQRWVSQWISERRIISVGKGKATVYKLAILPRTSETTSTPLSLDVEDAAHIPISEEGREILAYIRRPRTDRTPVSYDRTLLDDYLPNSTWYLSEMTRDHLRRIGDTGLVESPAGTYGRAILNRLLIDLSWASSRLEGNTYSRLDTQNLIEFGHQVEGKDAQETQMILNHKAAIELLVDEADVIGFNSYTFLNLHGLLSENLMPDPDASGRLRFRPVEIGGSVFLPMAIPQIIEDCFHEILGKASTISDPFEQAFFILVHIPYLQPFEDVNKRVSRLGANISLMKHNLCPLTFIDVPNRAYTNAILGVYEMKRLALLRDLFVWAYERSTKEYIAIRHSLADPEPFRLHYRLKLHELVSDIVRNKRLNVLEFTRKYAKDHIDKKDQDVFIEMLQDDIKRLHSGIIARYHIRPSEFSAWQEARRVRE